MLLIYLISNAKQPLGVLSRLTVVEGRFGGAIYYAIIMTISQDNRKLLCSMNIQLVTCSELLFR